jgi:hypothetical protein
MALLLAVLPIAAAGCGGSEVSADEVPGPPPALTVPTDEDLGGGGGGGGDGGDGGDETADAGNATDEDADADAQTDDTTDGTVAPEATAAPPADDTTGGTATPETAPEDTATNDTPPAGAEAEQFESFCEQNAGAC